MYLSFQWWLLAIIVSFNLSYEALRSSSDSESSGVLQPKTHLQIKNIENGVQVVYDPPKQIDTIESSTQSTVPLRTFEKITLDPKSNQFTYIFSGSSFSESHSKTDMGDASSSYQSSANNVYVFDANAEEAKRFLNGANKAIRDFAFSKIASRGSTRNKRAKTI